MEWIGSAISWLLWIFGLATVVAALCGEIVLTIVGGFIAVCLALLGASVKIIPNGHKGIVFVNEKPRNQLLTQGVHLVLPFMTRIKIKDFRTQATEAPLKFTSLDGVPVDMSFQIQYVPDETVTSDKGRWPKFLDFPLERIEGDILASVDSMSEGFLSELPFATINSCRKAIRLCVECMLCISEDNLPHKGSNPQKFIDALPKELKDDYSAAYNEKHSGKTPESNAGARIFFYSKCQAEIVKHLKDLRKNQAEKSEIENDYGIMAQRVNLTGFEYDEEIEKASRTQMKTQLMLKAEDVKMEKAKAWREKFPNLTDDEAVNTVLVSTGLAKKIIYEVNDPDKRLRILANEGGGPDGGKGKKD